MSYVRETKPVDADWTDHSIASIVEDALAIGVQIKDLKGQYYEKREMIREVHEEEGVIKAEGPGWTSTIIRPEPSRKLSIEKLLEHGVAIEVIENSYDSKARRPYVTVRERT